MADVHVCKFVAEITELSPAAPPDPVVTIAEDIGGEVIVNRSSRVGPIPTATAAPIRRPRPASSETGSNWLAARRISDG
jgi:hypothetical protein